MLTGSAAVKLVLLALAVTPESSSARPVKRCRRKGHNEVHFSAGSKTRTASASSASYRPTSTAGQGYSSSSYDYYSSSSAMPTETPSSVWESTTAWEEPTSTAEPSSTWSSSAAPSKVTEVVPSGVSEMKKSLFPAGGYPSSNSWSTSSELESYYSMDAGLNVVSGSLPRTSRTPDGKYDAIASFFPKGSINPANKNAPKGGINFYSSGPHSGSRLTAGINSYTGDLTQAKEITFSYSVLFQDDFQFQLGGKLPGVYGGTSEEQAKSCSGGRQEDRDQCFSMRMMWRADGMGELYNYLPLSANQPSSYCSTGPKSVCNPAYGDSIGRGAWYFTPGKWQVVSQRVKLNDVGSSNGELQVWVDGESVLSLTGLELRVNEQSVFRGVQAQTFFGGNKPEWASPQDQTAWFKDWSMAILN